LACGDQRRLTGSGSALEVVLHDYALYKSTFTYLLTYLTVDTCWTLVERVLSSATHDNVSGDVITDGSGWPETAGSDSTTHPWWDKQTSLIDRDLSVTSTADPPIQAERLGVWLLGPHGMSSSPNCDALFRNKQATREQSSTAEQDSVVTLAR